MIHTNKIHKINNKTPIITIVKKSYQLRNTTDSAPFRVLTWLSSNKPLVKLPPSFLRQVKRKSNYIFGNNDHSYSLLYEIHDVRLCFGAVYKKQIYHKV